jgi:dTDP-4-dehydrorhamnose reductase
MKILILGAKGSLGQAFVDILPSDKVVAWDRTHLDVTDKEKVIAKVTQLKPDVVINCAAYNNLEQAEREPDQAYVTNSEAVGFIVEACSKIEAILVHFGSANVFDGRKQSYDESDEVSPLSVYSKSKWEGSKKALAYPKSYVIRTNWLFGPPGTSPSSKKSFLHIMLEQAKNKPVFELVDDEFGNPTYVKDLVEATRSLMETKKPFGLYHLVNEGPASWYTWGNEIFKLKNMDVVIKPISRDRFPRLSPRPQYGILVNTKAAKLRPWQEALKEYLDQI